MCISYPLIKSFDIKESRPLFIPHEYIQPIEFHILEYIHNFKRNYKLNNLIQNTSHEFLLNIEEHKVIRALELQCLLLQTKYVICMLAKLLISSDTIRTNFPNGFFAQKILTKNFKDILAVFYICLNFFRFHHPFI